jgi:rubrerythrin
MVKKFCLFVLVLALSSTVFAVTSKTTGNLQAAFNGESNAHARYLEFAKRADTDGYPSVATLFRAAAKAEEVHAGNHAKVLRKLGAEPKMQLEAVAVKSTLENLQAAVKGESYERDTMYPDFLKVARSEGNADAIETFNLAKAAETEHARLYADAAKNLGSLKGKKVTYYVCTICGYTTTKIDFEKCPSCFKSKENYVAVA